MDITRDPSETAPAQLSSRTVAHNGVVYTTVIPVDGAGTLVEGGIAGQSAAVLRNLAGRLESAGTDTDRVLQMTVYLTDISEQRAAFNEVYAATFDCTGRPTRCAVGVSKLAIPGMLVELSVVAATGD